MFTEGFYTFLEALGAVFLLLIAIEVVRPRTAPIVSRYHWKFEYQDTVTLISPLSKKRIYAKVIKAKREGANRFYQITPLFEKTQDFLEDYELFTDKWVAEYELTEA